MSVEVSIESVKRCRAIGQKAHAVFSANIEHSLRTTSLMIATSEHYTDEIVKHRDDIIRWLGEVGDQVCSVELLQKFIVGILGCVWVDTYLEDTTGVRLFCRINLVYQPTSGRFKLGVDPYFSDVSGLGWVKLCEAARATL